MLRLLLGRAAARNTSAAPSCNPAAGGPLTADRLAAAERFRQPVAGVAHVVSVVVGPWRAMSSHTEPGQRVVRDWISRKLEAVAFAYGVAVTPALALRRRP